MWIDMKIKWLGRRSAIMAGHYLFLLDFTVYNMVLKKYPEMIMHSVTTPKKMAISFKVITFFKSIAFGKENPTTPIIKAMAVPNGIPLATNT